MQQVIPYQHYKHKDGGIYQALGKSRSTIDKSECVVYLHVYPFEQSLWHRPIEEWTEDRFELISPAEVWTIRQSMYQCDYRNLVLSNKQARKGT